MLMAELYIVLLLTNQKEKSHVPIQHIQTPNNEICKLHSM